ncbi:hypothetical protein [Mycobacterium spongiae]|uniref:hypothetical protein n=1 Tax=Mycobacterium spongiae TaxID=886343 RepID=UPI001BA7FD66|nr:hypothetical protein [Mycobacterium spongiae]
MPACAAAPLPVSEVGIVVSAALLPLVAIRAAAMSASAEMPSEEMPLTGDGSPDDTT